MSTWTTQDGRVLQIAWMDSSHLVNSFNMVVRKNNLNPAQAARAGFDGRNQPFAALRDEIKSRQLYIWRPDGQLVAQGVPREDFKTLCMLRAILDAKPANVEEIVELFHRNPTSYSEHVLTCADPKWTPVVTKFVEYRLHPPAQWR